MPDRPNVHVGLGPFEFAFCHLYAPAARVLSFGAHGADRTRDLSLTKGVLYH
jgi:hypothetical protein